MRAIGYIYSIGYIESSAHRIYRVECTSIESTLYIGYIESSAHLQSRVHNYRVECTSPASAVGDLPKNVHTGYVYMYE